MTKAARYVVIRDSELTLRLADPPVNPPVNPPATDPPVDIPLFPTPQEAPTSYHAPYFGTPQIDESVGAVLIIRVRVDASPVRLVIRLNNSAVLNTVIPAGEVCTFHEVVGDGLLREVANSLTIYAYRATYRGWPWPIRRLVHLSDIVIAYTAILPDSYVTTVVDHPQRVQVFDALGWVATFTNDAQTVTLRGPARTFTDGDVTVATTTWVRLLPWPFTGVVDAGWLNDALDNTSADVLEIAKQYLTSALPLTDVNGIQIAGDASYGPPQADGTRKAGADFHDYLETDWFFDGGNNPTVHKPAEAKCLDCSGFVRMVYGYRSGLRLRLGNLNGLPRHSYELAETHLGIVTIPNTQTQVTAPADFARLAPGDLVFFNAKGDPASDGGDDDASQEIDHVGIYLGPDANGDHRFISSRKVADGPMFSDVGGPAILNGAALYARSFRMAIRL